MFTKNQLVEVDITDINNDGEGVGRVRGYTLFIKDALIGDKVLARIIKVKSTYAYGRLERIMTPSSYRIEAPCPDARRCGGCQIQALSYEKQLEYKQNKVINNLTRIGGFERPFIESISEPIIGMTDKKADGLPPHFRYRNKAQYPVSVNKDGELTAGFYAGRTHSVIPIGDCLIGIKENKIILDIILDYMRQYDIAPYDEEKRTGTVRHILIRKGFITGEIMICLVINADTLPQADRLTDALRGLNLKDVGAGNGAIKSISYSINKNDTNVIMGDNYHTIYGADTITDYIGDLKFSISPLSFYQVNPVQTKKLYERALSYAALTGKETVWDLYCGIGTISLFMAGSAKKVYGVEVVPQAIDDARKNAALNGIANAEFFVGKAEEVVTRLYGDINGNVNGDINGGTASNSDAGENEGHILKPDVVVVDPPRKGCDKMCLDTILKLAPSRMVYISCDSATLARDLKILRASGYTPDKISICDMFPNTVHVETVCLLGRRKPDDTIKVSVNMDDYYQIRDAEEAEKNPS